MQIIETRTNTSKSLNLCKVCTRACHLTLLALPRLWSTTKPRRNSSTRTNSPSSTQIYSDIKTGTDIRTFKYFKMHTNTFKGLKLQECFYKKDILRMCQRTAII